MQRQERLAWATTSARQTGLVHDLGAPCMPIHNGIFAAMRRRHTRGGGTKVPPASCESPPLPSGRAARARVSDAFRLPPGWLSRVSETDATPGGGRAMRAPTKREQQRTRGVEPALLIVFSRWAVGTLVLRTLRAQRALICGSKCRNSLGMHLCACFRPKEKR